MTDFNAYMRDFLKEQIKFYNKVRPLLKAHINIQRFKFTFNISLINYIS